MTRYLSVLTIDANITHEEQTSRSFEVTCKHPDAIEQSMNV